MEAKPLSICMVVRALPFHRQGGLEYHTWDLAGALARRGNRVVLLTSAPPANGLCELPANVVVEQIRGSKPGDYSMAFYRNLNAEVDRLDKLHSFDVIHAQELAGLSLRARPGRLVVTVHGTMTSETPLYRHYWRRLGWSERLMAAWRFKSRLSLMPAFGGMLRRADALIVDSVFTRRELLLKDAALRQKISLVPLGLDLARYPDAEQQYRARSRIGVIGRVQKMKGIEIAVGAAEVLRARGSEFEMQIAGSGPDADRLKALITEAKLQDYVKYVGPVDGGKPLAEFFANLDVLLFPDLTQPAFGLVAVEAMRYGVPIVAARSGAIPEVVTEEAGWIYEPWDVAQLGAVLHAALKDEEGRRTRSQRVRELVQNFTADRMAADVQRVYYSLG